MLYPFGANSFFFYLFSKHEHKMLKDECFFSVGLLIRKKISINNKNYD